VRAAQYDWDSVARFVVAAFRADAAKQLFALATTDGFAFDVEVLLLADRLGMRIFELQRRGPLRSQHDRL